MQSRAYNFASYDAWCATWGPLPNDALLASWDDVTRELFALTKTRQDFERQRVHSPCLDWACQIEAALLKAHAVEARSRGLGVTDLAAWRRVHNTY